jgi:hypothetical protein
MVVIQVTKHWEEGYLNIVVMVVDLPGFLNKSRINYELILSKLAKQLLQNH